MSYPALWDSPLKRALLLFIFYQLVSIWVCILCVGLSVIFLSDFNAFSVCKTDICLSICACVSLSVDFCSRVCKALGFCCHYRFSPVGSAHPSPPGQDERSEPQQCGGSLLHPDWRPGPGHAGGAGGVLLQVQDRVAPNEGVHRASCCCLSRSGLSLLSLRQWC